MDAPGRAREVQDMGERRVPRAALIAAIAIGALAAVMAGCHGTPGRAAPRRPDAGVAADASRPEPPSADAGAADAGGASGLDADLATDASDRVLDAGTDAGTDAGGDAGGEPDAGAPVLRVVSLNLRCLVDDWPARRPILIDALAALDPELLGLQEACAGEGLDNLAELVAGLEARTGRRYTVHRHITHRAWERFDEGLAIVAAVPVLGAGLVRLPGGVFPRVALVAELDTAQGRLGFGTTHLDHRDAETRRGQAEALATALGARWGAGPAVLTGDFNAGPDEPAHAPLAAAGLVDVWAALRPTEPGFTFPASDPTIRIDYVRARGRRPRRVERLLAAPVGGRFASDHVGLLVELE